LCCDVSEEWTSVGRRYWERAGVANKITLKLGPASDTLKALPASHTFDFAFIDADKSSYAIYYEEILRRLRPNGLILIDNVLWNGAIVDQTKQDADTTALRKLNDFIAKDTRVEAVMLGIADGLTIVRKK
jgi:caffeoyl-CoA O-methyltransferase